MRRVIGTFPGGASLDSAGLYVERGALPSTRQRVAILAGFLSVYHHHHGRPPVVLSLYVVFYVVKGGFQHSTVDVKWGRLNDLISSPELHRGIARCGRRSPIPITGIISLFGIGFWELAPCRPVERLRRLSVSTAKIGIHALS